MISRVSQLNILSFSRSVSKLVYPSVVCCSYYPRKVFFFFNHHCRLISTATTMHFKVPPAKNEPMKTYALGSQERRDLETVYNRLKESCDLSSPTIPLVINGKQRFEGELARQAQPGNHAKAACQYHQVTRDLVKEAIDGALKAKSTWESMPFIDRAAIFLKAADLLATKHRYNVMAATMLGQGKNIWQAEIDAAAELIDFLRFNCSFADELQTIGQPREHAAGNWNSMDFRSLEGFVLAVSPFNFTAIGGNLACAPALMGNVVLWKPSHSAILSNYRVYEVLMEAGLPPGVIQFIPGPHEEVCSTCFDHVDFTGLHFTGSSAVFTELWQQIGTKIPKYKTFPRIVGETGGKNMHFVHPSASVPLVVNQTIRGAFEYQGQKCSACSRLYLPRSLAQSILDGLVQAANMIKPSTDMGAFMGPVINKAAFDKITGYIKKATAEGSTACKVLAGPKWDESHGYYINPCILLTDDPHSLTMREEIFGPVLTCFIYPDAQWTMWLDIAANKTTSYGLTSAFFATDREAIVLARDQIMRHSAGNFYINDKCTAAVVGAQPFGGARKSGTNDKAGSYLNLLRWTSPRTIKENMSSLDDWLYPSNASN